MILCRQLPFRLSQVTLFLLCFSFGQRAALAEEAPAVLQFARKYQQQAIPLKARPPAARRLQTTPAREKQTRRATAEQQQRVALQRKLAKTEQQLSARDQQLSSLRQQITRLKQVPPPVPAVASPALSEADQQTLRSVATTFGNLLRFSPSEVALAEKLRLADRQQKKSYQRLKRLLKQQQALRQQLADSMLRFKTAEAQLDDVLVRHKSSNEAASQASAALLAEKNSAEEKVKALQARLDAVLAQQKSSSASEASEALLAEKNSAEEKVKALQTRLDAVLAQQKSSSASASQASEALLAEKNSAEEKVKALQARLDAVLAQQKSSSASASEASEALLAEKNSAEEKVKALQTRLDAVLAQQKSSSASASQASEALLAEKNSAEEKMKALQTRLDETLARLTLQEKQREAAKPAAEELTPKKLKEKATREAYAIGFSLGHEILQIQAENRNWAAVDNDRNVVMAGIADAFQNKAKIPLPELEKSLAAATAKLDSSRKKFMSHLDKSTKDFISKFIKDKNTHKSDLGFWYRIGYIGDTPVPKNASIDVVVKESLANGKVIEDMDAKGIVLTQPVSSFPPVFSEALSKIKNHGSITIVVPPDLAYGEKGYPPKVPPNATMVYDIRIAETYPEKKKKDITPKKLTSDAEPSLKNKSN